MYLARTTMENPTRFFIRETYRDGGVLKSRDVFDLGTDPSRFIVYPGGKGYYFDEKVEETLQGQGLNPTQDDLDRIFWEFLDPAIKRVIAGFERPRSSPGTPRGQGTETVHPFDQRRVLYLRFARMDLGRPSAWPTGLFRHLHHKSRDEIEQHFLHQERILKTRELNRYVWTLFNLNTVFNAACDPNTPAHLCQESVDDAFMTALCALSRDQAFWAGTLPAHGLQGYLVRYAVMYFDHAFPVRISPGDAFRDFMNQHRRYAPPRKVRLNMAEASRLFEVDWQKLQQMDARTFTRLYRRQAMKHHPDQGGNKRKFIKLNALYRHMMIKKGT